MAKKIESDEKPVKVNWKKEIAGFKVEYNRLVGIEHTARGNGDDEAIQKAVDSVTEHVQAVVNKMQQNDAFSGYIQRVYAANWNIDWNELFDQILTEQR